MHITNRSFPGDVFQQSTDAGHHPSFTKPQRTWMHIEILPKKIYPGSLDASFASVTRIEKR
jgi:hypothetical protein